MLFPIALLFLYSQIEGSPTFVELVNSGLSVVGAKWVLPSSSGESNQEGNESGTRQSNCRDCSRKGRFAFDLFTTTTTIAPLPCCPGTSGCPKCGTEKTRRVIGGVETVAGVYPWIAALGYNGDIGGCSGTLISSNWAITAAHCIFAGGPDSLVLGEHDLSSTNDADDTNRKEVSVTTIVHPNYDEATTNNDIALLKLAEAVDLSIYTPACLPASSADYVGQTAKVYGWGRTDPCGYETSSKLLEAEVTVVSDVECDASSGLRQCTSNPITVSYSGKITSQMLCASATGKDACQGDSGGPLTVKSSDQHYLAGVVSWGYGCAADGLPGVYAEVAKLRSWVDATIASNGGIGATCDA